MTSKQKDDTMNVMKEKTKQTSFTLTLFNTDKNKDKEKLLSKLEIAFDDVNNVLPNTYYDFIEQMEYGKTYKFTFEELDAS